MVIVGQNREAAAAAHYHVAEPHTIGRDPIIESYHLSTDLYVSRTSANRAAPSYDEFAEGYKPLVIRCQHPAKCYAKWKAKGSPIQHRPRRQQPS